MRRQNSGEDNKEFRENLKKLIKTKCWSFIAGEGSGSVISLDFGEKVLRKKPCRNKYLSEIQRKFKGEYSLLIYCSWRFDSPNKILCGSKDSNHADGPLLKGLKHIVDKSVVSVNVYSPAYDIVLGMSDGFTLKIFCDETNISEPFDNFIFFTPTKTYSIELNSKLAISKREFV